MSSVLDGQVSSLQPLWEDGERVFCRGWREGNDNRRTAVLAVQLSADPAKASGLDRLTREYEHLDRRGAWRAAVGLIGRALWRGISLLHTGSRRERAVRVQSAYKNAR